MEKEGFTAFLSPLYIEYNLLVRAIELQDYDRRIKIYAKKFCESMFFSLLCCID